MCALHLLDGFPRVALRRDIFSLNTVLGACEAARHWRQARRVPMWDVSGQRALHETSGQSTALPLPHHRKICMYNIELGNTELILNQIRSRASHTQGGIWTRTKIGSPHRADEPAETSCIRRNRASSRLCMCRLTSLQVTQKPAETTLAWGPRPKRFNMCCSQAAKARNRQRQV